MQGDLNNELIIYYLYPLRTRITTKGKILSPEIYDQHTQAEPWNFVDMIAAGKKQIFNERDSYNIHIF